MADERDPKVSQRYRELGSEEPSRELDQAILSAAHRAADKPHAPLVTPAGRHRWYFSLGAAAVIVLAVAVTYHMQQEAPDPDSVAIPAAPEEQRVDAAEDAPKLSTKPAPTFAPDPKPRAREPARELTRKPAAPAAGPAPEARMQRDAAPAESRVERQGQIPPQQEPITPAPAGRADSSEVKGLMSDSMRYEPPERWLERIVQLRKEGKHEEADKLLAEFRRRYPDYRLSEAMLGKVERR